MLGSTIEVMAKYRPPHEILQAPLITDLYLILILCVTSRLVVFSWAMSFADVGHIAAGTEEAMAVHVSVKPPMESETFDGASILILLFRSPILTGTLPIALNWQATAAPLGSFRIAVQLFALPCSREGRRR